MDNSDSRELKAVKAWFEANLFRFVGASRHASGVQVALAAHSGCGPQDPPNVMAHMVKANQLFLRSTLDLMFSAQKWKKEGPSRTILLFVPLEFKEDARANLGAYDQYIPIH